jgi:hypothetical protein
LLTRGYRPGPQFSLATMVLDILFGAGLVYFSNGFQSPYFLAFFLTIIASAVRFGTTASLVSALAISFIYLFIGGVGSISDLANDASIGLSGLGKIFLFVVVALATGLMTREMERERRMAISRAAQADALREMSVNMASTLDIKDVFKTVLQQGIRMTGTAGGQVVLVFEDGVQVAASTEEDGLEVDEALFRQVAQSGEAAFRDEHETMVVAIASGDGVTAVLRLRSKRPLGNEDLFTISALAGSAAVPLANALHYSRSAQEAVTDGLTGLLNHREFHEALARALGKLGDPLDRVHLRGELGEDGRLVPGARADVEDALAATQVERLADPRHHVRLRDRLSDSDRQRSVVVGARPLALLHEELARNGLHRPEHALVDDVAPAQLRVDHDPAPGLRVVRPHARGSACRPVARRRSAEGQAAPDR